MRTNVGLADNEKKLLYAVFLNGPLSKRDTEVLREEFRLIGRHFRTNPEKLAEDGIKTVQQIAEKLSGPVLVLFTFEEENNRLIVSGKPFSTEDVEEFVNVVSYGFLFPFIRKVITEEVKEKEAKKLMAVVSLAGAFSKSTGIENFNVVEAEVENGMFSFITLTTYGTLVLFRFPQSAKEKDVYAFMEKYLHVHTLPVKLRREISEYLKKGPVGVGVWSSFRSGIPFAAAFAFSVSSEVSRSLIRDLKDIEPELSKDDDVLKVVYFQEVYGTVHLYLRRMMEEGGKNESVH